MLERFSSDLGFILIVLIVAALLGCIIGYLIGKKKAAKIEERLTGEINALTTENKSLKAEISALQGQLSAAGDTSEWETKLKLANEQTLSHQASLETAQLELQSVRSSWDTSKAELDKCKTLCADLESKASAMKLSAPAPVPVPTPVAPAIEKQEEAPMAESSPAAATFNASAAKEVFGKKIKENDLTLVEGIGPVLSGVLNEGGINTWLDLSNAEPTAIKEMLLAASSRHKIHNPGTWPKQARLAHEGQWQELSDYQNILDGGKEPTA